MSVKETYTSQSPHRRNTANILYTNKIINIHKEKQLLQLTTDTFVPISFGILVVLRDKTYLIITFFIFLWHNTYQLPNSITNSIYINTIREKGY